MDNIDFSIIFNSRGRVPMLTKMLECIEETCSNLDRLEVIVNFDTDDIESISAMPELNNKYKFLQCLINERELNLHVNVNKMAFMAKGKYIWALGDDCHIMTKEWDKIAIDRFETAFKDYEDKILLGAVNSTSVDKQFDKGWYCDAPILTREGRDGIGYLIHPHFISLGADVATWMVYAAVNRIVDMRDICFDHVTHNTLGKVMNPDKTAAEYRERQAKVQKLDPFTFDYSKDIEKIKGLINE
tara:strand:+ start:150 stop:878 length:729 start_codon:yes stop_codon:yes gene_type:complete